MQSQPPPPPFSIHLTLPSPTYQSPPRSVCFSSVHHPQSAGSFHTIISLYSTFKSLSLSCFLSSTFSLLLLSPLIISYSLPLWHHSHFISLSSSLLHPALSIPFSYGWWGPGRAGSVSSRDPRPPPQSPGHKLQQSPSSPAWKTMTEQQRKIDKQKDKRLRSRVRWERWERFFIDEGGKKARLHIGNICCSKQKTAGFTSMRLSIFWQTQRFKLCSCLWKAPSWVSYRGNHTEDMFRSFQDPQLPPICCQMLWKTAH